MLPTIPDVRLLCCCVIDPCPVNHCSHSIFLKKDTVLRPPVEPAVDSGPLEKAYLESPIWSPPVLQAFVSLMAGTGLLPYIRPVNGDVIPPGLDEMRAYRPYR